MNVGNVNQRHISICVKPQQIILDAFVELKALKTTQSQRHLGIADVAIPIAENLGGKTYFRSFYYKLHIRIFEFVIFEKPQRYKRWSLNF